MSTLQKFNNTIEAFEEELIKLKDTSESYQKLRELIIANDRISEVFSNNTSLLEANLSQQQSNKEALENSLVSIQEEIKSGLIEFKTQNESFESNLSALIDKFRKENRDFYLDMEKTVRIKLDENKSEIRQLIEAERARIKEIFETELSKRTNEILTKQKSLQTLIWIIGSFLAVINLAIFIVLLLSK